MDNTRSDQEARPPRSPSRRRPPGLWFPRGTFEEIEALVDIATEALSVCESTTGHPAGELFIALRTVVNAADDDAVRDRFFAFLFTAVALLAKERSAS